MKTNNLAAELRPFEEAAKRMQGWQFEYTPDVLDGDVPWNYDDLAATLAHASNRVVDIGTGGGEAFLKALTDSRCDAFATEEWGPNAPVAAERLKHRAPVTRCSSSHLPFSDDAFDLVLARHEAIDPKEIARVLSLNGKFLSQQVIRDFMFELGDYFPETVIFPDFFTGYQDGFRQLGLQVTQAREFRYQIQFRELGHLVYQLIVAPWTVPGFTIDTHLEGLEVLNEERKNGKPLIFTGGYYLLEVSN